MSFLDDAKSSPLTEEPSDSIIEYNPPSAVANSGDVMAPFMFGTGEAMASAVASPYRSLELLLPSSLWSPSFLTDRAQFTLNPPPHHHASSSSLSPSSSPGSSSARKIPVETNIPLPTVAGSDAHPGGGTPEQHVSLTTARAAAAAASSPFATTPATPAAASGSGSGGSGVPHGGTDTHTHTHTHTHHHHHHHHHPSWSLMEMQRCFLRSRYPNGVGFAPPVSSSSSSPPLSSSPSAVSASAASAELASSPVAPPPAAVAVAATEEHQGKNENACKADNSTVLAASDMDGDAEKRNGGGVSQAFHCLSSSSPYGRQLFPTAGGEEEKAEEVAVVGTATETFTSLKRRREGNEKEDEDEDEGDSTPPALCVSESRATLAVESDALAVFESLITRVRRAHDNACPLCAPELPPAWFSYGARRRRQRRLQRQRQLRAAAAAAKRNEGNCQGDAVASSNATAQCDSDNRETASTRPSPSPSPSTSMEVDVYTRRVLLISSAQELLSYCRGRAAHLNSTRPGMYTAAGNGSGSSGVAEHALIRNCRDVGGLALIEALLIGL